MTPDETTGANSLREWLKGQTREVAVTIAQRAAMRVAPIYWRRVPAASRDLDLTAIATARALLIAGVAGTCPTLAIRDAAAATAATAAAATAATAAATAAAHAAAIAAAHAAAIAATTAAAAAGADANAAHAAATAAAHAAIWKGVRQDAARLDGRETGQAAAATPLWPDGDTPLGNDWKEVRTAWAATGDPGWQFWIDWYEAALAGRPLLGDWDRHWALLTDIALIPDDDWKAGPDRLNPIVASLFEKHELRKQADDLLAENARLRDLEISTPHPPRDHNKPPEILELDHRAFDELETASAVARSAVADIAAETRADRPDADKLEESATRISDALQVVLKFLGGKADLAVDTLIKWGVPAGVIWLLTNQEKLAALVSGVR